MSDVDTLRRIAERGMRLAHQHDTQFVDIFQHMLDEIQRYDLLNPGTNADREKKLFALGHQIGKTSILVMLKPAACDICGYGITYLARGEDDLLHRVCNECGSVFAGQAESVYNKGLALERKKDGKGIVGMEERKDGQ